MKIDSGSLFFNAPTKKPGATASWGTALGQGKDKKINRNDAFDLLIAMDYCAASISDVKCDLGQSDIIKAAIFYKVYVSYEHEKIAIDKPFILLVTRENEGIWAGRLTLKYAISAKTTNEKICNKDCFDKISELVGGANACWFAYDIDVENQDELIFSIIKVSDNQKIYPDSPERGGEWKKLIENENKDGVVRKKITFIKWLDNKSNCKIQTQSHKKRIVEILESALDSNITEEKIGNLFCYSKVTEFAEVSTNISELNSFKKFNKKDGSNQPQEALYLYQNFLNAINFNPKQIIYYGVPGSGKSWIVNDIIDKELNEFGLDDKEYHRVRCVFHQEYCNADFVGQIYPYVLPDNKGVEYRFKPGPFAEIVRRAFHNPYEPFYLIIEEINRGNAAAIFGEIFQLLDRIKPGDDYDKSTGNEYGNGWSSYGVDNADINAYIRQKCTDNPKRIEYEQCVSYSDKIKLENYTSIRLPPNLSIYATMNTSDQNVFTMDNAFQRRFKFKMIENELDNAAQYDIIIGTSDKNEISTDVRWGSFRKWINKKILSQNATLSRSEDKCLGGWFIATDAKVDENGKIIGYENISREDFAEKVLKYLWYDVFKRNTGVDIFNKDSLVDDNGVVSFAMVAKTFKDTDGFDAFKKIFKLAEKDEAELKKTYVESISNS